jgi:hypothetical protein
MLDELGWVTPPKQQGGRGTCQTFAAVGAIESEYLRQYGLTLDLSEEYLINMFNEAIEPNWTGGNVSEKMFAASYYALPPETDWPYIADEQAVIAAFDRVFGLNPGSAEALALYDSLDKSHAAFNPLNNDITSYNSLVYPPAQAHKDAIYGPSPNSVQKLQLNGVDPTPLEAAITAGHPVAILTSLAQWTPNPQADILPRGGHYDYRGVGAVAYDHAVLLVGYDHAKKLFRIKNSWGPGWNGNGFAEVSYNLILSDNADPAFIGALRNPQQPVDAGVGALRGFWAAMINGVSGVVVVRHAYQDAGRMGVVSPDAGHFYGNDGSVLPLEWGGGEYNSAVFTVQSATSATKTICLFGGPGEWSYVGIGASGIPIEIGRWSRTRSSTLSDLHPANYLATRNDPYLFAVVPSLSANPPSGPPPGPAIPHQPSIFVRLTGEADVVAQGWDNSLMYYYAMPGGNWLGANLAPAGTTFSQPSVFVRASGEADIVAQGPNDSLTYYNAMPGKAWSSATIAGAGTTISAPSVFVRPNGEADVVARGVNNSLMYYHAMPGSGWSSGQLGAGTVFSAPSIFVRPTGEADVVAQGPGNSLVYFHAMPNGNWSGSEIGAGTVFSAPSIFVRSTGEADVVAEGPDHSLMYYWAMPGSAWSTARIAGGGTTYSAPSVFVRSNGEADVVAQGWNGSLDYYNAMPGGAWSATQIGGWGTALSAPSVVVRPSGEVDLATQGPDGSPTYYHASPGGGWYESEP